MQTLADIDFAALTRRPFHPSPAAWEDQAFYFFLLDRFSDGDEAGYRDNTGNLAVGGAAPLLRAADHGNAVGSEADAATWRDAGARFVGGTLRGATSKIGYLKRLGVSALWVSPVFKQPPWSDAYHGYGVQDFLAIDPRFGSREDLRELVATAHAQGIHVILDVILNHAGPVFTYAADRYPTGHGMDPRWDGRPYPVAGWNDAIGEPGLPYGQPVADPNAAIWPRELQASDNFSRLGRINNCYYGSEQGLDGAGGNDRYIREATFRSRGRHCFDENHPIYVELARLLAVRRQHLALRRGRQYLRAISGNGRDFGEPHMIGGELRSVGAWSRLFNDREWLCAINTDDASERAAWVGLDHDLSPAGSRLVCLYSTHPAQIGSELEVTSPNHDWRAVWLALPAAGCAVYGPVD